MSDNWVIQNLENALNTWNEKLAEIWTLITQSPQQFKGGTIWNVMVSIHGAIQAIGIALLVLFFVVGVMKTCGSFAEVKKPEHALKLFIRFALAKGAVTYGLELMLALLSIVQGVISTIMNASGYASKYLSLYNTYICDLGNGNFQIWYEVMGTDDMDEIGVLSIELYEVNSDGSLTWLKTFQHEDYSSMLAYNDYYHCSYVSYKGSSSKTYKAQVCIWAGKDGSGDTRYMWATE